MGISLKVIIFLMTASVSLISVTGNPDRKTTPKSSSRDSKRETDNNPGIIGGVVGGLALLVTLVVVLILLRHKLPCTQVCFTAWGSSEQRANAGHNTEGNHGDPHYEEIQVGNQQVRAGSALPSLYATVNSPADQLHYASVNFQKDSVSVPSDGKALPDTTKNGSSACDYSSISSMQDATHPPAAEQTLYSTVTKPGGP